MGCILSHSPPPLLVLRVSKGALLPLWRKRPPTYLVQASRLDPLKFPLVPSSLPNRRFCNRNLLGVILSMSRKYKFGDSSELYFISFAVIPSLAQASPHLSGSSVPLGPLKFPLVPSSPCPCWCCPRASARWLPPRPPSPLLVLRVSSPTFPPLLVLRVSSNG
jgi:hypothetical protein